MKQPGYDNKSDWLRKHSGQDCGQGKARDDKVGFLKYGYIIKWLIKSSVNTELDIKTEA